MLLLKVTSGKATFVPSWDGTAQIEVGDDRTVLAPPGERRDQGKLLESETLIRQTANNTKEQFANSPDLAEEILHAIMDAYAAHTSMSRQALESQKVRQGLRDVLLGPARLYEALRTRSEELAL